MYKKPMFEDITLPGFVVVMDVNFISMGITILF
jgi:hypothetical protein